MLSQIVKYIKLPKNLTYIHKHFDHKDVFNILDVGCGSHYVESFKECFPNCFYYGIDKISNNHSASLMEKYYKLDLTTLDFHDIPDDFFHILFFSHIIEHLANGDQVVQVLLSKLKSGGIVYIEFPSFWSTKLPSKKGTLNFFDDSTHCRLYSLVEIYNLLMANNFKILKGGTRRNIVNILLTPYNMIRSKKKKGFVAGSVFWDILGFAQFVLAQKL